MAKRGSRRRAPASPRRAPAQHRRGPAQQPRPLLRLPIVVGVVGVALVAALFVIYLSRNLAPAPAPKSGPSRYEGIAVDGRTLGAADASLLVSEYSDFQCPYCRQASETILTPLLERYVRTGRVRFRYQPVALIGPESARAAEAALCAQDQGRFFPYHDALFAAQAGENRGAFNDATLKRLAREVGLDERSFATCLDSGGNRAGVEALTREAEARGVRGVPAFFIGGERMDGLAPFSTIQRIVEQQLARK